MFVILCLIFCCCFKQNVTKLVLSKYQYKESLNSRDYIETEIYCCKSKNNDYIFVIYNKLNNPYFINMFCMLRMLTNVTN